MPARVRCAIYTRRSVRRGDRFSSCSAQFLACAELVNAREREGWRIAFECSHDDDGESGASEDRPGLDALVADVRAGRVDRVVVYRLDRLARSVRVWSELVQLFLDHGVGLTIARDGLELGGDALSRLQLNVMATFAEFERELIRDRQADALAARTAHGLRSGGRLPLGYASEPRTKQLVIVAKEAALVRDIFRALDEGERPQAIADRLNAKGARNKEGRRGEWNARAILRIGRNRAYAGERPGGARGVHEAIVDAALFARVSERLTARRTREPTKREGYSLVDPYLLRGLIVCDACGKRMTTASRAKLDHRAQRARRAAADRYYRCRTPGCGTAYVNAHAAEGLVYDVLRDPPRDAPPESRAAMRTLTVLWPNLWIENLVLALGTYLREIRWDSVGGKMRLVFDEEYAARAAAREPR